MSIVSTRRQSVTSARSIRVDEPGLVSIQVNGDRDTFEVEEFQLAHRCQETPARGFVCTKFGGEKLHILIAIDASADDVCTCPEFAHRATCIHALGFRALLKRGQLENVPDVRR